MNSLVTVQTPALAGHGASMHTDRTRNIWIPVGQFTLREGTPVLALQGGNTRYRAWALDGAGTQESIITECILPEDWASGVTTLKLHWTNLGAGAGNVRFHVEIIPRNAGDDLNNNVGGVSGDFVVAAPLQNILTISTHNVAWTPGAASQHFSLIIFRTSADAADTLANDLGLVGVELEYTADQ